MVVPESLGNRIVDWAGQSWLDIVWQAVIAVGAIVLAAALIAYGSAGVVLGFLIIAFLFREPIHDALEDVWERNFWRP